MFSLFKKPNRLKETRTPEELKQLTRILFVDDTDQSDLISYLKSEGWDAEHVFDIEQLSARNVQNANLLFIDIMGVGAKLKLKDGLDLIKLIKDTYPSKKIVMYSTNQLQDFSHPGFELADKKIVKRGSYDVFITSIMEMSRKMFDWKEVVRLSYEKLKPYLQIEMTQDQYEKVLKNSVKGSTINKEKVVLALRIGYDIFQTAYPLIDYAIKGTP